MTNCKFVMIHDLGSLSEAQRVQHLRDISHHIGLDPDLNAIDMLWMPAPNGQRRLTPYARKGTTDLLRKVHGISVLHLTQHDGPGYVSFTATGKAQDGRQEVAVGAASTNDYVGDKLAAAVATAQTRALRRLTLQFVGFGILDESELDHTTTNINRTDIFATMQIEPAPQPTVQPDSVPGRDVTAVPEAVPEASLAPAAFSSGDITPEKVETLQEVTYMTVPESLPKPEPETKKPRKRRSKSEIQLDETNDSKTAPTDIVPDVIPVPAAVVPEPEQTRIQTVVMPEPAKDEAKPVEPPKDTRSVGVEPQQLPNKERDIAWRADLFKYTEPLKGLLAQGGLSERVVMKTRKLAFSMFPGVTDTKDMNNGQWLAFLAKLAHINAVSGPEGLVKVIEENYLKG